MSDLFDPSQQEFYSDVDKPNPFMSKEEHGDLGWHVPGQNFLPPQAPPDNVSGTLSSSGNSDTFSREDHFHGVRVGVFDHDPVDPDFADPRPGMIILNELGSTLWIRGTSIWFSVAMTPH